MSKWKETKEGGCMGNGHGFLNRKSSYVVRDKGRDGDSKRWGQEHTLLFGLEHDSDTSTSPRIHHTLQPVNRTDSITWRWVRTGTCKYGKERDINIH